MPNYAYAAKGKLGQDLSGLTEGTSVDEVISRLHTDGLTVLSIVEAAGGETTSRSGRPRFSLPFAGKPKTRDLALFTRQMSTILNAGIPLIRGLRGLASGGMNQVLARAASDVANRVEKGETFSDAMEAHPEAFNKMYVNMIRAGERAGTMDAILNDVATYLEKSDAIKSKVKGAMSYPIFVLVFALGASAFLMLRLVPTFADIYADMGQKLPALTRGVLAVSNAIRANILVSLGVIGAIVFGISTAAKTTKGRRFIDSFLLDVPIFGPVIRKTVMGRFTRTLGILLRSGMPILAALEMVKGTVGNVIIADAVKSAAEKIGAGHPITGALRSTRQVPEMVLQLVATGEETGELDTMLLKAAEFFDRQVEAAVEGITLLIEPMLIVFVGGIIGIVVVAMFLPIFYMGDAIMKGGF